MIGQPYAEWKQRYTCTDLCASKVYASEREAERARERKKRKSWPRDAVGYARAWSLGARALWLKGKEEERGSATRAQDFLASERDSLSYPHRDRSAAGGRFPERNEKRNTLCVRLQKRHRAGAERRQARG